MDKIDFLKVEAEGFEPEVLNGLFQNIRKVRKIAVDCSPERYGESPLVECKKILEGNGFDTYQRNFMLFAKNKNILKP